MLDNFWFNYREMKNEIKEENEILNHLFRFQFGDFSMKEKFVDFFLHTSDWNEYVLGVRLFMAICSHSDLEMITEFLSKCNEKQLQVFLAFMPESLTVQTIPLLLALSEDWKGTYIEQDIALCIREMLGSEYDNEVDCNINELGNDFILFSKENDLSLYYYRGKPYFAGDMTKRIVSMAMYCRSNSKKFLSNQMPSILSNGTGIKCPVYYGMDISNNVVGRLYGYINKVINKQQVRGQKYFYNHLIK